MADKTAQSNRLWKVDFTTLAAPYWLTFNVLAADLHSAGKKAIRNMRRSYSPKEFEIVSITHQGTIDAF